MLEVNKPAEGVKCEILNRVSLVGLTEQMAFEQRPEESKEEGQAYAGEEQSSQDSQVAGCPEGPRNREKGGVFRAEKVRRA